MAIEFSPPDRHPAVIEEASTAELVREAMDEAKELLRLEVELAKGEAREELARIEHAAIAFGIAAAAGVVALSLLAMALVLVLGGSALAALAVAGGFAIVCAVAGGVAYAKVPRSPLEKTRGRLKDDVNLLKEHIA